EERQTKLKELQEAGTKEVNAILKPEQTKRLTQISRQQDVLRTLTTDEEAGKALKLSDEQKEKLKGINDDITKDMRELFKSGMKGNFQEMQEKMAALRKEGKDKALKVLSDDQTKAWKDLVGEPFEVKFEFNFGKKKKIDD